MIETSVVEKIVEQCIQKFRCFGIGSRDRVWSNPVAEALKDTPPTFAAGVDVRAVVEYVLQQYEENNRA